MSVTQSNWQRVFMTIGGAIAALVMHGTSIGAVLTGIAVFAGVANILGIVLDSYICNTEWQIPYSDADRARNSILWVVGALAFAALVLAYIKSH